jgi:hypothetical protein
MICIVKQVKGKKENNFNAEFRRGKRKGTQRREVGGRLFLPSNYGRRKKRGKGVCERLVFCNAIE